jgi:hypothetical protein
VRAASDRLATREAWYARLDRLELAAECAVIRLWEATSPDPELVRRVLADLESVRLARAELGRLDYLAAALPRGAS